MKPSIIILIIYRYREAPNRGVDRMLSRFRRGHRSSRKTWFAGLLIHVALIVLIPIGLFNLGWNLYVRHLVSSAASSTVKDRLLQTQQAIDTRLQSIDSATIQLGLDPAILQLIDAQTVAKAQSSLSQIRNLLLNLYVNGQSIDSEFVYDQRLGILQTIWNTEQVGRISNLPTGPKLQKIARNGEWATMSLDQNGQPSASPRLALIHPLPIVGGTKPEAYLIVEINPQSLFDGSAFTSLGRDESIWMTFDGRRGIDIVHGTWVEGSQLARVESATTKLGIATPLRAGNAQAIGERSTLTGWTYIDVLPNLSYRTTDPRLLAIVILGWLLMVPIILWLSRKLYRPIQLLVDTVKVMGNSSDSPPTWGRSERDLNVIYDGFKTYESRTRSLEAQLISAGQRAVATHLLKYSVVGQTVTERILAAHLPVTRCLVVLAAIHTEPTADELSATQTHTDVLRDYVEAKLQNSLGNAVTIIVAEIGFEDLVVVSITSDSYPETRLVSGMRSCLSAVASEVRDTLGLQMMYEVSHSRSFITEISAAYREAVTRMHKRDAVSWQTDVAPNALNFVTVPSRVPGVEKPRSDAIGRILQFVDAHYTDDLSLVLIADQFALDPSYVSRLFKSETGVGFARYLAHLRITQACLLLSETPSHIHEIAKQVGYQNLHSFMRVFKKHCGITPSEYRNNAKQVQ